MTDMKQTLIIGAALTLCACNGIAPARGMFTADPGIEIGASRQDFDPGSITIRAILTNRRTMTAEDVNVNCQGYGSNGVIVSALSDYRLTLEPGQSVHVSAQDLHPLGHVARWACHASVAWAS